MDTGANFNCVEEDLIPSNYFEKTKESLLAANSTRIKIYYKIPSADICKDNICYKTSFMLVKNLNTKIILGNPFLQMLYPFSVSQRGFETMALGQKVIFEFLYPINTYEANMFQNQHISKINSLQHQINFLKDYLSTARVHEKLQTNDLQNK